MPALNRFAISALSKVRKDEAVNQEIMIDKKTGEFLLKDNVGNYVSYDSISRLSDHIKDISLRSHLLNIAGDLYQITLDNLDLPGEVTEDVELIPTPMLLHEGQINKLLLSLDIDMMKIVNNELLLNDNSCLIEYDLTFKENETNSTKYSKVGTVELYELLTSPFIISYPTHGSGDTVNYKVVLNSLKVKRNTLDSVEDVFRFILNNLLMIIK